MIRFNFEWGFNDTFRDLYNLPSEFFKEVQEDDHVMAVHVSYTLSPGSTVPFFASFEISKRSGRVLAYVEGVRTDLEVALSTVWDLA